MKPASFVVWPIKTALFALYGLWVVVASLLGLVRGARRTARLLGTSLRCPSCAAPNTLHGRWHCRACGAVYHGFVGACPVCGAGAAFFPCASCGVSIRIGGVR